jgi:transcriptional regulator with GAF, ATPase, and Fis domain
MRHQKQEVVTALAMARGCAVKAADALGVCRMQLNRYVRGYGLHPFVR